MPGFLAAAAPAAIAGIASLVGGERSNRAARQEAQRNRDFQREMSNTAWQRAVADMEKAGLNPAVAYGKGPASSPGGSMAAQSDTVTPAVTSAMQAQRFKEEVAVIRAQAREAVAKASIAEDEAWKSGKFREYYDEDKGPQLGITGGPGKGAPGSSSWMVKRDRLDALLESRHGLELARTMREQGMARVTGLSGDVASGFQEMMPGFQRLMRVSGSGVDSIAGAVEMSTQVARMRDDAVMAYFGMPKKAVLAILRAMRKHAPKTSRRFGVR